MEANRQPFFKIIKKKLFIKIVILKHSSDCKKTTRALFQGHSSYLLFVSHLNWPISKILELQIIQVRFLVLIYKVARCFHGFTNLFHQSVKMSKTTNSSSKQTYQECACMSMWKSRIQSNFVVGHVTSP